MNNERRLVCQTICLCLAGHLQAVERDGLANSLDHIRKANEDNQALYKLLIGDNPYLPLHV